VRVCERGDDILSTPNPDPNSNSNPSSHPNPNASPRRFGIRQIEIRRNGRKPLFGEMTGQRLQ